MGGSEDRRFEVLRAIVADYVSNQEPIGSKAIVDRHSLGVSSATVRNDMVALEEEGYIAQPHTSAGRIPTDKGYRMFVDRLSEIKPLSTAERRAITNFLDGAIDIEDVLQRSVRLLAQLTRQVAVVQYPRMTNAAVRHVEVLPLTSARLMLVVITDTGRVDQRTAELGDVILEEDIARIRDSVNAAAGGYRMSDAAARVAELPEQCSPELRDAMIRVSTVLAESMVEHPEDRLVLGGTANLTRSVADFPDSLREVLEALEEQVVVLKLLAAARNPGSVSVRIGGENEDEQMRDASVVSVGYGMEDTLLGGMGVVGPTRMDYPSAIASVRAVANYVGEIVSGM